MKPKNLLEMLKRNFNKPKPSSRIEYCYVCEGRTEQSYHNVNVRGRAIDYYVCCGCKEASL